MKTIWVNLLLFILLIPSVAFGAGFAHDANFLVLAPNQQLAEDVLASANDIRAHVAKEWLGEELPPSVGRTVISVTISEWEDRGLAWPIDTPKRTLHKVWLRTTQDGAVGGPLAHEVVHIVLATQFRDRLPAWADEGVASTVDDGPRVDTRRQIVAWFARTGNWPSLATLLDARSISPEDQATYSAAASVTQYLLSRGGKAKFLQFAVAGKANGWNQALKEHYSLRSVTDLQGAWQAWARSAASRTVHRLASN